MIKNLLDEAENQPNESRAEIESQRIREAPFENSSAANAEQAPVDSYDDFDSEDAYDFTLDETPPAAEKPMFQTDFKPESLAETTRKSGMAYAAAITLFGSIVFLMALGWFADLLLGTSPWGIVAGIVLGSVIGFFQFFRITSQILKDKD